MPSWSDPSRGSTPDDTPEQAPGDAGRWADDTGEHSAYVTIEVALPAPRRDGNGSSGRGAGRQDLNPDALSLHPERLLDDTDDDDADEDGRTDPDAWFVEAGDVLAQAYCVTLVQGIGAEEAFDRVGARPGRGGRLRELDDVVEKAYETADRTDGERQVVGASEADGWTVLVEPNGNRLVHPELRRRLSAGTTVVTLYSDVNGSNEFCVTVDGATALTFDRFAPADREGERAGDYADDLHGAGFLDDEEAAEGADEDGLRREVAAAALVERLTGIRLTQGFLADRPWATAQLRG